MSLEILGGDCQNMREWIAGSSDMGRLMFEWKEGNNLYPYLRILEIANVHALDLGGGTVDPSEE